jgi:hypothetical protein
MLEKPGFIKLPKSIAITAGYYTGVILVKTKWLYPELPGAGFFGDYH